MSDSVVYDKAKYHLDGFPVGLEREHALVHTGMFLGWVIDTDLYSKRFGEELKHYVVAFKMRELTGAKVFEACDGVLSAEMLSHEGNRFAQEYFDLDHAKYLLDYDNLLCRDLPSMYHVADTW